MNKSVYLTNKLEYGHNTADFLMWYGIKWYLVIIDRSYVVVASNPLFYSLCYKNV